MFTGLGTIFAILPIMLILFVLFALQRKAKSEIGDERISLTNEVLSGIRIIKYYAWEHPLQDKIELIRKKELGRLFRMNTILVGIIMLITSVPYLLPIVIFSAYAAFNSQSLDATVAFTTLSLLGLIMGPMSGIPAALQRLFQALNSVQRICDYLQADELNPYVKRAGRRDDTAGLKEAIMSTDVCIKVNGVSASWLQEVESLSEAGSPTLAQPGEGKAEGDGGYAIVNQEPNGVLVGGDIELSAGPSLNPSPALNRSIHTLSDLSLTINKGELTAIVGPVGSGKSSILSLLLGDLTLQSGSVYVDSENVAYHSQQAWIFNASVRDNILLGQPMNRERFAKAVRASCLQADIDILPAGLDTEIGEKGINLSGGQVRGDRFGTNQPITHTYCFPPPPSLHSSLLFLLVRKHVSLSLVLCIAMPISIYSVIRTPFD